MSSTTHGNTPYYFVPQPSRHPFMAALGLFFVILGAGQWVNGADWGKYSLFLGLFVHFCPVVDFINVFVNSKSVDDFRQKSIMTT